MFCFKCGANLPDGSDFCPKCGTKQGTNSSVQAAAAATAVGQQTPVSVAAAPKKKKHKVLIIVGVVLLLLIIIIACSDSSDDSGSSSNAKSNSQGVNLSQTYINEEEGIYFKYPSEWILLSKDEYASRFGNAENYENVLLFLANDNDEQDKSTYIEVSRFNISKKEDTDIFFADDEQFVTELFDDVDVKETSITKIDGVRARTITYTNSDGASYQNYFYYVGSKFYRVIFYYFGESAGSNQKSFDAIMDSYKITSKEQESTEATVQSYAGNAELDPALIGRWRSFTGKSLTLEENGNVSSVFSFWNVLNGKPDYVGWEASNGLLVLNGYYNIENTYAIGEGQRYINGQTVETYELSLGTSTVPKADNDGTFYREKNGNKSLIGIWKPGYDTLSNRLELYDDGTGIIGENALTWYADETNLYYTADQRVGYDYTVSGDTLTIFYSDGSEIFTRVGN